MLTRDEVQVLLVRQARAGKGKGPLVHTLWRRLPQATRRDLTTTRVWAAHEQLLAAARQEPGEPSRAGRP